MPSDITIASNALLLIGDEPINSFDEPGAGARAAKNLYPVTKENVLSYHPWSFALKEVNLNQLTTGPDEKTNLKYAYQLPPDRVRIWEVMPYAYYELVGDKLYSNHNELLMRYVWNVPESQLPAAVVKAIEYKLASEMAISVTEDENKAQLYEQKYRDEVARASNQDAQGRPQEAIKSNPFIQARFSGPNYGVPGDGLV